MRLSPARKKDLLWLGLVALLLLLPAAPGLVGSAYSGHVLTNVLLYAAAAQAWNIVGGYGGQVSFGHSVFFGIGAYGAAMAVVTWGGTPWPGALAGAALASAVAVAITFPVSRLKGHYFAIATFAIVEIFNRLFLVWDWIGGALGLDYPILPDGWRNFAWSSSKVGYYYGALGLLLLVFSVVRWMERHRAGFYLRAVREGQETAESLGVNVRRVKLGAMALSAFLTALCGAFFAQYNFRVDPPMVVSLDMSMRFVLIAILGGLGTFYGPLLGAAVLIPLQEYTRAYLGRLGAGMDLVVFGVLIVVMMVRQPMGAMGVLASLQKRRQRRRLAGEAG